MTPRRQARFVVPGTPRPKGSRTTGVTKTGVRFTRESNPRTVEWMRDAKRVLRAQHQGKPLEPPYAVTLEFTFQAPQKPSWPRTGDVDKYSRAVLDSLVQAGVLEDDRHVVELSAVKRYGEPGTLIEIAEKG